MTRKPTKSRAERKLESLENEMTPDDDQPDSLEVTFNHVRVDLPPKDRVGADDGDADESGERHSTVDGDLDDYEHTPESVHAHYWFDPATGRYDIPVDDDHDDV